jgi:TRAP-type C4-dicarboxylate transport system substrate-binding protein
VRQTLALSILSLGLLVVPGSALPAHASRTQYIRVATLLPRDSEIARSFLRVDRSLRQATHNAWGLRLYAGGVAGDEPDILRKMKIGQIDASIITTTWLSHIVRDVAVLDAPGVVPDS